MKKSMPAKFPKNEMNQFFSKSTTVMRRCRSAVVMNWTQSAEAAPKRRDETHHNVRGEQICPSQDNHNEADWKQQRSYQPDKAGSVPLIPRCCICALGNCAAEGVSTVVRCEAAARTYPKPSRGPAITELMKSLSRRIVAFFVPILDTSSVVCVAVKASILAWLSRYSYSWTVEVGAHRRSGRQKRKQRQVRRAATVGAR